MPKRLGIDELVDRIATLRTGEIDAGGIDLLTNGLASKHNIVAAKSAKVINARQLKSLEDALAAAFVRFLEPGSDKGCLAKQAIAEALYETGSTARDVFERGVRHFQPEPSFGGSNDSAAELRGVCALGMVRCGHPRLMEALVDLLNDPELQVRVMAARAVGYAGHDTGALLLRMKILAGDRDDDVIAEAFAQLVRLQPRESIPFVERFLDSPEHSVRQSALLALGSSRDPQALQILIDRWPRTLDPTDRSVLALAIASHRSSEAVEFLLVRLAQERVATAVTIVEALQTHRHDEALWSRVRAIVNGRDESLLTNALEQARPR